MVTRENNFLNSSSYKVDFSTKTMQYSPRMKNNTPSDSGSHLTAITERERAIIIGNQRWKIPQPTREGDDF
jgi:hypothetical protein